MHLLWGGTPENGVTAQEDEEAESAPTELDPTKSITIDKGGNYEIPGGNYAGNITINLTDITETVNITIKGNIKPTSADPFIDVKNAGVVNVEMGGHEFDGTAKKHFMYIYNPTADVTVSNGMFKARGSYSKIQCLLVITRIGQQAVDQTSHEGVTATDTIHNMGNVI